MNPPFVLLSSSEQLQTAYNNEWSSLSEIAIDLECENNLHHYGSYISLIQLSSRTKNWIIDALSTSDMRPFVQLLENAAIRKVFHDVSFDLRIICHQWLCRPRNIFDTQIAAFFLGKAEVGLGSLLETYFGVHKMHKYQMADWTKRPLTEDMLSYAVTDTLHLLPLKDRLTAELQQQGRLGWVTEECAFLEQRDWEYMESTFSDLKGFHSLLDIQRGIVRSLFLLRNTLAQKIDRPVHFILPNSLLMKVAKHPLSLSEWENLRGVHPLVRREALRFYKAVEEGKKNPWPRAKVERKKLTTVQRKTIEKLEEIRDTTASTLHLPRHLIANQDQLLHIALSGKYDCLRSWQKKLLLISPSQRSTLPFRRNCEGYLLDQRGNLLTQKSKNGFLIFPGGGIQDGETPELGLVREAYEETGAVIAGKLNSLGMMKLVWGKNWATTEKQRQRYEQYQRDEMHFFWGRIQSLDTPRGDDAWKGRRLIPLDEAILLLEGKEPFLQEKEYREAQLHFLRMVRNITRTSFL